MPSDERLACVLSELETLDRQLAQARRGENCEDLHLRMKSTVRRLNSELDAAGNSGSDLISRLVRKTDWGYEVQLYNVQRATKTLGIQRLPAERRRQHRRDQRRQDQQARLPAHRSAALLVRGAARHAALLDSASG